MPPDRFSDLLLCYIVWKYISLGQSEHADRQWRVNDVAVIFSKGALDIFYQETGSLEEFIEAVMNPKEELALYFYTFGLYQVVVRSMHAVIASIWHRNRHFPVLNLLISIK